jgi:hypothetical protein
MPFGFKRTGRVPTAECPVCGSQRAAWRQKGDAHVADNHDADELQVAASRAYAERLSTAWKDRDHG